MKLETLFLKIAVVIIGIPVFVLCILGLFRIISDAVNPEYASLLYPILVGMYASTIPFFFALIQTLRLLTCIDKNKAFSDLSVKALKNIKYCAFTISIVYVVEMPFFYLLAEKDDTPGIILIGMGFVFASFVVAVFAAVLQKLLNNAIEIKEENDLTV
ncbi:MAG: putative rane protein [Anaerocolumna sp.]|jgi:hypothetical protein|nr:putative rane protein [Anaerocolumna sp.]